MPPINQTQNRKLHLLLTQCQLEKQKAALVFSFSNERTESSKELSGTEAESLINHLKREHDKLCKPMRSKILHYLGLLGFVLPNGKDFDYTRIDNFIKNIGSNNPRKVILNYLYYSELPKVLTQVEAMYKKESKKLEQ